MVRLVLGEDSYLIREGLRLLLDTQDDLVLVGMAADLPGLLAAVEEHRPDVVLTDIRMPPTEQDEGVTAAEVLAIERPDVGVVVLSQYVEADYALRLFATGARGRAYLLKERVGDLAELRHAISSVVSGGSVLDPLVVDALLAGRRQQEHSRVARLTPREQEVLQQMAGGRSNTAIADALSLTVKGVEKHISAVFAKLDLAADDGDIHRRVQAVLLYLAEAAA